MSDRVFLTQVSNLAIDLETQPIHAQARYRLAAPAVTAAYPVIHVIDQPQAESVDSVISGLGPFQRWRFMAKNDRMSFVLGLASLAASLYCLMTLLPTIGWFVAYLTSSSAHAAERDPSRTLALADWGTPF